MNPISRTCLPTGAGVRSELRRCTLTDAPFKNLLELVSKVAFVVGGLEASGSGSRLEDPVEPFREPGSAPAKPLGSRGSLRGTRVAAGLVVGRPHTPHHHARRPTTR